MTKVRNQKGPPRLLAGSAGDIEENGSSELKCITTLSLFRCDSNSRNTLNTGHILTHLLTDRIQITSSAGRATLGDTS